MAMIHSVDQNGMENELQRLPTGPEAAVTASVILDPDAQVSVNQYFGPPENLLYVAGGRHGLWAMDADPRSPTPGAPVSPAVLLDDSGSDKGTAINTASRRWCNAVDVMELTINGEAKKFGATGI